MEERTWRKKYKYEELMQLYTNAMEIIDQLAMDSEQQIERLKDTAITDEIALDFCESAKCYIEILLKNSWINQDCYNLTLKIAGKFDEMSKDELLWTEDALKENQEWEECRILGKMLSKMMKKEVMKELDVVSACKDLSEKVKKGCIGTIVYVYENPNLAYEVEFFDDEYNTIELITVEKDDILYVD